MRVPQLLTISACAVALTACAHSQQAGGYGKAEPSGFLSDYSKLRPAADDTEATLVYFNPDKAKLKSYTAIWLEPVQVWRGEKSDAKISTPKTPSTSQNMPGHALMKNYARTTP